MQTVTATKRNTTNTPLLKLIIKLRSGSIYDVLEVKTIVLPSEIKTEENEFYYFLV